MGPYCSERHEQGKERERERERERWVQLMYCIHVMNLYNSTCIINSTTHVQWHVDTMYWALLSNPTHLHPETHSSVSEIPSCSFNLAHSLRPMDSTHWLPWGSSSVQYISTCTQTHTQTDTQHTHTHTYMAKTSMVLPLMTSFPSLTSTSPSNLPWVESYLNR